MQGANDPTDDPKKSAVSEEGGKNDWKFTGKTREKGRGAAKKEPKSLKKGVRDRPGGQVGAPGGPWGRPGGKRSPKVV